MRAVLDTNVVASALLWGGTPGRLIELAGDRALELATSEALIAELAGILNRPKFAEKLTQKNLSVIEVVAQYRALAETIEAAPIEQSALRDPDDEAVIGCALAARADLIVSGDQDLLVLKTYGRIRLVSAAEALRIVAAQPAARDDSGLGT